MWNRLRNFIILVLEWLNRNVTSFIKWRQQRKKRYTQLIWYRKIANVCITSFVLFLIYLFVVDCNLFWLFGKSPNLRSISNPNQNTASVIISSDGKVIGKYFSENRTPVTYEEISPILIKTLIATEDVRFYKHFGVDFRGLFAAAKDMTRGKTRGASTITQQLVKNMYKTRNQYSTGLFGYIPGISL